MNTAHDTTNDNIATHRNNSGIQKPIGELQSVATLATIDAKQRAWLDAHGFEVVGPDAHGNVSLRRVGGSIGDPNAVWSITEERQLWEVSAANGYFVSAFTGRFHVCLISQINGRERCYDRAAHVTLRAALMMTKD